MSRQFYVYIMTNQADRVLYTGVTNDLKKRVWQHRNGIGAEFTKRYKLHKLVYYEIAEEPYAAITREKQIKAGSRQKKLDMINGFNPEWRDLYNGL